MSVLDLTRDLIACRSVTPADAGCQQRVAGLLAEAGFHVETLQFGEVTNLWATHGEGGPLICLAGHTDVVPPGPEEQWSSPPFLPEVREGKLYGRGASDMKASVAAMALALQRLAREGHPGTVAMLLTSDEEGPGIHGTRAVLDALASRSMRIDGAIVGEPTSESTFGDVIKAGRRGSMTGDLEVAGIQGHTAYPDRASNATHRLAPALAELVAMDWGAAANGFPATTLQVTNLRAGAGASNVIPGRCHVQFNVRFGVSHTPDEVSARVAEVFLRHGIDEQVEWDVSALPFATAPGALVDAMRSAVHEVCGLTPVLSNGGGTSDARFFAMRGIPVVEFGPLNASIHAIDEHVEVDCLEPLANVYHLAALRALGQSDLP